MKITAIKVYQVDLPLIDGTYKWADGKSIGVLDCTVVVIETDKGVTGYGEVVPLGSNYLPSYAEGVRTGIKELGPKLLGLDPRETRVIYSVMDYELKGHPYVKSPIDMACWDILGKVSGLPLCTLLGGCHQTQVPLSRSLSQGAPHQMAQQVKKYKSQGYSIFQLKLGGDVTENVEQIQACREALAPEDVLIGDANGVWLTHHALQVTKRVEHLPRFYLEQPCQTYEECLVIRNHCSLPIILDECVADLKTVVKAWQDQAADVIDIKISKFGGLTKAKEAIEFCVSMGIAVTIVDTWGSDLTTAAILHLASTVPKKLLFRACNFISYNKVSIAKFLDDESNTSMDPRTRKSPPNGPGLGLELDWTKFKTPSFTIE